MSAVCAFAELALAAGWHVVPGQVGRGLVSGAVAAGCSDQLVAETRSPRRPAAARGADRGVAAAGGGALWAGGLLVPVRGLELRGHHQESPGLRPHRL